MERVGHAEAQARSASARASRSTEPERILRSSLTVAAAATLVALSVNARTAGDGAQAGDSHAPTAAPIDPIISTLPAAVVMAYQERFPRHRVWQSLQTGEGEAARYELTIFDPSSTMVHVQGVESGFVQSHAVYKLILSGSGRVIREQQHPIAENDVPSAVREAFDQWNGPFGGMWVGWFAYQEEGAERHYTVSIVLNALEGYGATFDGDGALVRKLAPSNKHPDRAPPRDPKSTSSFRPTPRTATRHS